MLFTDPKFLFVFLPLALGLFYLVRRYGGGKFAIWFLLLASGVFYGYWSVKYLALLLGQVLVNYMFARRLNRSHSNTLMWVAIGFNLLLLGYFKYRNFFLENLSLVTGHSFHLAALFIPLGISFHTFQQITYLTDVAEDEDDVPPLPQYILFVMFFPQLIAGPIVLHNQIAGQLSAVAANKRPNALSFGPGFALFCFGLFKKVCIADNLANFVDTAFVWPQHLQCLEAWCAAAGFCLQLFFDFSGYSDMAIGLGLMFGFLLPFNFNNPLASRSITDFWNRWHITMTRFFTMYVYSPLALAANRAIDGRNVGPVPAFARCIAIPTLITFLAAGLWHGAGWTFVVFGLVHGVALTINRAWREAKMPKLPMVFAWLLTMIVVLIGNVFFRSQNLTQALSMLKSMFLPGQFSLPLWAEGVATRIGLPVQFYQVFQAANFTAHYVGLLLLLAPLAILLPNPSVQPTKTNPSYRTAFAVAAMLWLTMGWIGEPRTFLYFQF